MAKQECPKCRSSMKRSRIPVKEKVLVGTEVSGLSRVESYKNQYTTRTFNLCRRCGYREPR